MTLPPTYFDGMYAASPDPWGFGSRWYEQRKYALTLAALPDPRYVHALEIGCSIGVLTSALATRCDRLLGLDPSATALGAAADRVPDNVDLRRGSVPGDWPAGRYDLVVLSEVGYYLDRADLSRTLDLVERDLVGGGDPGGIVGGADRGGIVVACHWRHRVADYPRTGDDVHADLAARWPRLSRIEEEDFLLDVLAPSGARSVARRTGLLG